MNPTTNRKVLSEFLKGVVIGKLLEQEVALEANELPTPELQEQALDLFGDNKRVMELIVRDLLNQASGKIITEALPKSAVVAAQSAPAPDPISQGTGTATALTHASAAPAAQVPAPQSFDIVSALKEDLLDRYFPYMGRVGWVIRDHVRQAWQAGKKMTWIKWALALWLVPFLWSPFWWAVRTPYRWAHNFRNRQPVVTASPAVIPIPQITSASYIGGHKMMLRWNPVGEGFAYRIFRSYGDKEPTSPMLDGQTVNTPGAIVNVAAMGEKVTLLAVMAVGPQGQESELSQPVRFDLKAWNDANSIEPLAIEAQSPPAAQTPAMPPQHAAAPTPHAAAHTEAMVHPAQPSVPAPTGLTWQPGNDQYLYLQWNSVGPGYRYNVYASPVEPIDFTYNDPENDKPITDTRATWFIPKDKGRQFLFEVKALDAQGHESAASGRMEADLP